MTTMYDVIPLRALGALPFEYTSGLSCIDRIRSSTTVDATGSRPAVGSSYMMTCTCVPPEQVCSAQAALSSAHATSGLPLMTPQYSAAQCFCSSAIHAKPQHAQQRKHQSPLSPLVEAPLELLAQHITPVKATDREAAVLRYLHCTSDPTSLKFLTCSHPHAL